MAYFNAKSNNRRIKSQFFEKIFFFLIWEQSHNFRCLFFVVVVVVIVPLKKCNSKIIF